MSYWNYRIVRKKYDLSDGRVEYGYGLYEAFYDDHDKVHAITEAPQEPYGDTVAELRADWLLMAAAFAKPILDFDQIPEDGASNPWAGMSRKNLVPKEKAPVLKPLTDEERADLDRYFEQRRLATEQQHYRAFCGYQNQRDLLDAIVSEADAVENQED